MPRKIEDSTVPSEAVGSTDASTDALTSSPAVGSEDFENLGELPRRYDEDTIFLIAQEPHWLFCYWDIDIAHHPGGPASLRCFRGAEEIEAEIEVSFETHNWYIPVSQAGAEYAVEIGFYRGDQWKPISRSVAVQTPPEGVSQSEDFAFATVPFHLSFQRLIDNLAASVEEEGNLVETVARMQRNGDFSAFGLSAGDGDGHSPSMDPLVLLAALAGPELHTELSNGSISSAEVHSRVHAALNERISSGNGASLGGGSSESLSSGHLVSPAGSSGGIASGGLASGAFASELLATFSSRSPEEVSSWLQGATLSWSHASGGETNSEHLSSRSEWSGIAGPSSWSLDRISSWLGAAESSGFPNTLSSWLQGVQSSRAGAANSSWGLGGPSSDAREAESSWASGSLSAPFSYFAPQSGSHFLPDGSAGIVFEGGHTGSTLSVEAEPSSLDPAGGLRDHFRFPADGSEIQVVARSPTGFSTGPGRHSS